MKTNDAGPKLPAASSAVGFQNIHVLSERNYRPPIVNGGFYIQDCRFCGKFSAPTPRRHRTVELRADAYRSSSSRPQTFDFAEPVLPDRLTRRMQGSWQRTHRPSIPAKMRYDQRLIVGKRGRQPARARVGRCASDEAQPAASAKPHDERVSASAFDNDP